MREHVRIAEPETVSAWREEWCGRALEFALQPRARRAAPTGLRSILRAKRPDSRLEPAAAGAEVRDRRCLSPARGPQRSHRSTTTRITSPSRFGLETSDGAAAHTPASVSARSGSCSHSLRSARPRRRAPGRPRCESGCGPRRDGGTGRRRTGEPLRPRPCDLPSACRPSTATAPTSETNCYTDVVIELAARTWRRAARGDGHHAPHRLRRRPVDVLQTAARRADHPLRRRRARNAAIPPSARPDRGAAAQTRTRSSSRSTPGICPDTAATSYHTEHVKTSIAPESIDPQGERLPLLPQLDAPRTRR